MTPQEAKEAFEAYGSIRKAAKVYNVPRTTFRRLLKRSGFQRQKDNLEVKKEFGREAGSVTTKSLNIKTLDDALKVAEVDLDVWEVDKHIVNSWEMTSTMDGQPQTFTNYQVKVWLKRKVQDERKLALECIVSRLNSEKISTSATTTQHSGDILVVPGLYDMHFGMLAWGKETGDGDYDLKVAEEYYVSAIDKCLDLLSSYGISKFLLPIGQDFFHINAPDNLTPKGKNRLDVDSRLIKVFEVGQMAVIKAIEKAKKVAPVKISWIPGNHDPETSYYLCKVIEAYYVSDNTVEVDVSPKVRKFEKWGQNLLGFTHGSDEPIKTLPTIMADSCPNWWGQCQNKEWLIGHTHKQRQVDFISVDSFGGTKVRTLPSLSKIDAWHYQKGYVGGNKSADMLCYDQNGLMGYFPIYQSSL